MSSENRYDIEVSRYDGHTPGPWTVIHEMAHDPQYGEYGHTVGVAFGQRVITLTAAGMAVGTPDDYAEQDRNCALIADAPKLLAAYQAQSERIEELEDILAEVANELQYMYASYHSHVLERDRREDEELIWRANEAIGDNDG